MGLFRKQVTDQQHGSQFGEIALNHRVTFTSIFSLFVVMFIIATLFVANASYTQTQTVVGQLSSTEGDITYTSPNRYVVDQVFVHNGQVVEQGTPLIKLVSENHLADGVDSNQLKMKQLHYQVQDLKNSLAQLTSELQNKTQRIDAEQKSLTAQTHSTQQQQAKLLARITIAQAQKVKFDQLAKQQLISALQAEQYHLNWLELTQQQQVLQQQLNNIDHQHSQLTNEREAVNIQHKQQYLAFSRQLSDKTIEMTQLKSSIETLFVAQKSGVISTLNVKEGQRLKAGQFMFTITPKLPKLYAELLIPSRAIGFVQTGAVAHLKLQAFPFEKFGALKATITNVPSTIIQSEARQSSNQGPVYQVVADLSAQTINTYGEDRPLQNGMMLTADILIERRSLAEWLFEPIIAALGAY